MGSVSAGPVVDSPLDLTRARDPEPVAAAGPAAAGSSTLEPTRTGEPERANATGPAAAGLSPLEPTRTGEPERANATGPAAVGLSPLDPTRTSQPEAAVDTRRAPQADEPAPASHRHDRERYQIIGEHGRGGLGRVFRVHDRELGRDIAIKELLSRGDVSEVRFLREALITARLEHPGIVPVHEAGRWPDGTPFYAMKLVSGRPLRELIAERPTVDERLGLLHHVIAVADAIAYAHDRNVIHRDLKPANVIVGEFGETIVIDWGLAKDLTVADDAIVGGGPFRSHRDDDLTAAGSVLGTPAYMAPEQERGEPVDQRADVFAIGAMLWELCALQKVPPSEPALRHRMLRGAGIDRDLVTILDKALEPDPARRYPHAGALAADLKAFKSGARIAARSYSLPALLSHWIRRHRALALSVTTVVALAAIGGALYVHDVAAERDRVDDARKALVVEHAGLRTAEQLAEARLTQSYVERGRTALLDGKLMESAIYLAHAVARGDDTPGVAFMLARATQPLQREQLRLLDTKGLMWWAAFSPDGRRVVTAGDAGARLWDAQTGQLLFAMPHEGTVRQAVFTADGARLASAGTDGVVKVWDTRTGALVHALARPRSNRPQAKYWALEIAPDSRWVAAIASPGDRTDVWDGNTGAVIAELSAPADRSVGSRFGLAQSTDGASLAVSGGDNVRVFDTRSWRLVRTLVGPAVRGFRFDPTGRRLAVTTSGGDVAIWDPVSGERVAHLQSDGDASYYMAFSPDGALLATSSTDGVARVWNTATHQLQIELKNHRGPITWVEFDPSSRLVVTAGADGRVVVSDILTRMEVSAFEAPRSIVVAAHFDPSSRRVVSASWDGTARVWDVTPMYRRWASPPNGYHCSADSRHDQDRRFVAVACDGHGIDLWDTAQGRLLGRLPDATLAGMVNSASVSVAVSADGDRAAVAVGNTVAIYDLKSLRLVRTLGHSGTVKTVAYASTGHDLVSASVDGAVVVLRGDSEPLALAASPGGVDVAGFLPDGRVIVAGPAAAGEGGWLRTFEAGSARLLVEHSLPGRARSFRLSPGGSRIAILAMNGTPNSLLLWDVEHDRLVRELSGHRGQVSSARFVSGGEQILTTGFDGSVRLWDGLAGLPQRAYLGAQILVDASLSPDGTIVVGADADGMLRFWDVASGAVIWGLRAHRGIIGGLHFEAADLVTWSIQGEIARWKLPSPRSSAVVNGVRSCLRSRIRAPGGGLLEPAVAEQLVADYLAKERFEPCGPVTPPASR